MHTLTDIASAVDGDTRRARFAQPLATGLAPSACADAEGSGEGAIFDRAPQRVEESRLRRMLERHLEDELRHRRLLDEHRAALELPSFPVPERP